MGGFALGWVLLLATAAGIVLQIVASRIGLVTGRNLQRNMREQYGPLPTLLLLLLLEAAVITADLQEVTGSAIALQVLTGAPLWLGVLVTAVDVFLVLLLERYGADKMEKLFASLVGMMALAFVGAFFVAKPDAGELLRGTFVPTIPKAAVTTAIGTVGAIVMPHNIYLGSSTPRSRFVPRSSRERLDEALCMFQLESTLTISVSFFINAAVVAVFAQHFYDPDGTRLCPTPENPHLGCQDVGLAEADEVLESTLGPVAKYLWGIGLLAAGQSSTMTGTYAGQYLLQGFADIDLPLWQQTLLTRSLALVPCVVVAVLFTNYLDALTQAVNVVQSLLIPFAVIPLIMVATNAELMGPYVLPRWSSILLVVLITGIISANLYAITETVLSGSSGVIAVSAILAVLYIAFCAYLICVPPGQHRGHIYWRRRHTHVTPAHLHHVTEQAKPAHADTILGCLSKTFCVCDQGPLVACPLPHWVPRALVPTPAAPSANAAAPEDIADTKRAYEELNADDFPWWRAPAAPGDVDDTELGTVDEE